jgi:hypothetical protein
LHGLKHQQEKRSMEHFAGLDVSVNETSVCIVDGTGRIVREVKVASEPGALLTVLNSGAYHFKRIGLEAGPLSQWLYSALAEAGLPVICVETRHMRAVLKARITLIAVIEMSLSSWLVAGIVPWRRAPALEEACGRRKCITKAATSLAGGSGESRTQDRAHCRRLRGRP